jgi:hypothetical protein
MGDFDISSIDRSWESILVLPLAAIEFRQLQKPADRAFCDEMSQPESSVPAVRIVPRMM